VSEVKELIEYLRASQSKTKSEVNPEHADAAIVWVRGDVLAECQKQLHEARMALIDPLRLDNPSGWLHKYASTIKAAREGK